MSAISLTIYLGKEQPQPVPLTIVEALESVEITLSDSEHSGFQMVFQVGRSGVKEAADYKLLDILNNPDYFAPYNRVILVVTVNGEAKPLVNGVITQQEFMPSPELGRSTFTITGEDIGGFMDRENPPIEHIQQHERTIVQNILNSAKYARYNIQLSPAPFGYQDTPSKNDRTPTQQKTDLKYIQELADRFGYVFHITPGPGLFQNTAYWGPPIRDKIAQPTITINMGGLTNAGAIRFSFDAQVATQVDGYVQDRITNEIRSVNSKITTNKPLAQKSAAALIDPQLKQVRQFQETARDTMRALVYAQSQVNQSNDNVVTVSGELDTVRYGGLLQLRGLVDLRGVGYTYDGTYYVKNVTHKIRKGDYKQSFTLTREGIGGKRRI
jgi:hypothetical protein